MRGGSNGWRCGPTCSASRSSPASGAASGHRAAFASTPYPDAATNALARLARAKRRRGYRDTPG